MWAYCVLALLLGPGVTAVSRTDRNPHLQAPCLQPSKPAVSCPTRKLSSFILHLPTPMRWVPGAVQWSPPTMSHGPPPPCPCCTSCLECLPRSTPLPSPLFRAEAAAQKGFRACLGNTASMPQSHSGFQILPSAELVQQLGSARC